MRLTARSLRILALAAVTGAAACHSPDRGYDPLSAARAEGRIGNVEAGVPPQCYTKTGNASNPCWVCHTERNGRNLADDWELQRKYDFSEIGRTNRWTNLFVDRRAEIARISDGDVLAWIRQDNYTPLRAAMAKTMDFAGWRPDLDYARGFDAEGFARDGSGWRAFRYKPFPGTFWPTNGSTDDVMVRLPAVFRNDAAGRPSSAVYKINLAIVEAAVSVSDAVPDQRLHRPVEPVDEAAAGMDLDGDGKIGGTVETIRALPGHYAGAASGIAVRRYDYPEGTEFLHTVHYVDPDAADLLSVRMKEVRYAVKRFQLDEETWRWRYADEVREQLAGGRPHYAGTAFSGQTNGFGWKLLGYIEDAAGRLRLQTREEQLFCMGCHTGIGVTVDQSFSLPRKLPGASGWGRQRLDGMPDAPQAGSSEPEYLRYLKRVGAGDEFRANSEMIDRFFTNGNADTVAIQAATAKGIHPLVTPSRERALALDKAYWLVVREQGFRFGRDAVVAPVRNVHERLGNSETELKASGRVFRDGRLWLDWESAR